MLTELPEKQIKAFKAKKSLQKNYTETLEDYFSLRTGAFALQ